MSTLETTVFKLYLQTTIFCTDDNSSWIFCFIVYLVYNFCIISHNDLMIFVFFYRNVIVLQIKIMICFFLLVFQVWWLLSNFEFTQVSSGSCHEGGSPTVLCQSVVTRILRQISQNFLWDCEDSDPKHPKFVQ